MLRAAIIILAVAGAAAAAAGPAADPILRLEGESRLELDAGAAYADLLPLIVASMRAGAEFAEGGRDAAELRVERLTSLLEILGLAAVDRLDVRSELRDDRERTRVTLTLDPGRDGGLLRALCSVAPAAPRFGRYLDERDVELVLSVPTFAQNLAAVLDHLARPDVRARLPQLPTDAQGDLDVAGFSPRHDLLPLLGGEAHLLVLAREPGAAPGALPPVALVLAASDGEALRDRLLELAGRVAAATQSVTAQTMVAALEAGLHGVPGVQVGDFRYQSVPGGPGVATAPDWLVVTSDPARFQAAVARAKGLDLPRCRAYARVPGEFLVHLAARRAAGDEPASPLLSVLQSTAAAGGLGTAELVADSRRDRLQLEARQTGRSPGVFYGLLRDALAAAPAQVAAGREAEWLADTVGALDAALTTWGADHDDTFPADPQALVVGGYLPGFPALSPTPLGVYAERAYTYVPLREANGRVTGYFLFVYGGGADDGYDVFTPENLAEPSRFVIAADGRPDGVLHFCYDGTAIPQVEAWNQLR